MAKLKTGRHTSALKALRQARKRTFKNKAIKSEIRDLARQIMELVNAKKKKEAQKLLPKVVSAWFKAGRKNVVHSKAASRRISRISKAVHKV